MKSISVISTLLATAVGWFAVPPKPICEQYDPYQESTGAKGKIQCLGDCLKRKCSIATLTESGTCFIGGVGTYEPDVSSGWASIKFVNYFTDPLPLEKNVALNKPATAAPKYEPPYLIEYGNNGNFDNFYHSQQMTRPWWIVDLLKTFKITKVTLTGRKKWAKRHNSLEIYVTKAVVYDTDGNPDFNAIPLFAKQLDSKTQDITSVYEKPGGQCGRYIIVARNIEQDYMELAHTNADGHPYD